jgi:hypothetical protein
MMTFNKKPRRFVISNPYRVKIRKRTLAILGVFFMVALVSLVGCAVSETTNRETAISAEIDQVLEDYITAFNNYDLEAIEAVLAEGYMLYETSWDTLSSVSTPLTREYDRGEVLTAADIWYPAQETQWERLGEAVMTGDDPWLVSQVIHVTSNNPLYPYGIEGITILTIIDENGTLKVARDVFVAFEVE